MRDPRTETSAALEAVRAGLAVAVQRTGAEQVTPKDGVDIVTGADVAAEDAIRRVLSSRCPSIPIIGEERGGERPSRGAYWLVDPICGTRNYASRIAAYCTNVALIEDGVTTIAVVGDGGTQELSFAERGGGAFVRREATDVSLRARTGSVIGLELGGKPPYRDGAFARAMTWIAGGGRYYPRLLGTTLDFVKVAAGDMAALLLLTDTADPLHTAAGCLLAEEAGAIVCDRAGAPWSLDSTTLIAAVDPVLRDELLRVIS